MPKANLSIVGMLQWNPDLFKDMPIPETVNRTTLKNNIILECAELQLIWTDPDFLKQAIDAWGATCLPVWDDIVRILSIDYDPQWNKDLYEEGADTTLKTGTDTTTQTGTDTLNSTGTDTIAKTGTDTLAKSGTDTLASTGTDTIASTGTDTMRKTGTVSGQNINTSVKDQDIAENSNTSTSETEQEIRNDEQDITNSVNGFNSAGTVASMAAHDHQDNDSESTRSANRSGTETFAHTKTDDTTVTDTGSTNTTNDLTDTRTLNTQNQETKNLQDLRTISLIDQATKNLQDQRTKNLQDQRTKNLTDQQTKNLRDELRHHWHVYGNIGSVSSQELLMKELELRQINIYKVITADFKKQFCLQVYY